MRNTTDRPGLPGIDDVLVFEHADHGFLLIGGAGRGLGWAGIVQLDRADESIVAQAWRRGRPVWRVADRPRQVAGPYHARCAAAVPIGQRHVVVFGSAATFLASDAVLVRQAANAVDRIQGVPADKLLADELELVHAVRALMAYRPETVRETMRHIAGVATRALSCELALIRVDHAGMTMTEGFVGRATDPFEPGPAAIAYLTEGALAHEPVVDQAVSDSVVFGSDVASQMVVALGMTPGIGAMAFGHASDVPRGFTSLCQRIGRALAEAAELLLTQAIAREQLAAERDLLARLSGTDALTGIANRRAWDSATATCDGVDADRPTWVLTCDLDGLKAANDRYGHSAGDALLRATAHLLGSTVRATDLVARIGGDEFAVLLRDADQRAAQAVRARVRRAERMWRVTEHGLRPGLSIGIAPVVGGDIEAARCLADRRMYVNKRRRQRGHRTAGPPLSAAVIPERRRTAVVAGR